MDEIVSMFDGVLILSPLWLASVAALAAPQATDDKDPSELAYDHFRGRYELYSTIGDMDAEEFRTVTRLSLAGSDFGDEDVPYLAGLVSLVKLDLSGTRVTDAGMKALGELDIPLQTLILADTPITDAGLFRLAFLDWLEELDLSGTRVSDEGLVQLPRFRGRLRSLTLGATATDAGLRFVPALSTLQSLSVPVDRLTTKGFRVIGRSRSLRSLELTGAGLTRETMGILAAIPQLERLDVSGFEELDDSYLGDVGTMESLRELDLAGTSVTNGGLKSVASIPNLEWLSLSSTAVTDRGMKLLGDMVWSEEGEDFALKTATNIEHIELASTAITDRGLEHLRALPITSLDISRSAVTSGCRETLDGWRLRTLVMEGKMALNDLSFVSSQPLLERLDVSHRRGLNTQIRSLDAHPSLVELDLSHTDVQDSAMMPLTRCTSLRRLNLSGTAVTAGTLEVFAKLGHLERVGVHGTNILVHGDERREQLPGLTLCRLETFPAFRD